MRHIKAAACASVEELVKELEGSEMSLLVLDNFSVIVLGQKASKDFLYERVSKRIADNPSILRRIGDALNDEAV